MRKRDPLPSHRKSNYPTGTVIMSHADPPTCNMWGDLRLPWKQGCSSEDVSRLGEGEIQRGEGVGFPWAENDTLAPANKSFTPSLDLLHKDRHARCFQGVLVVARRHQIHKMQGVGYPPTSRLTYLSLYLNRCVTALRNNIQRKQRGGERGSGHLLPKPLLFHSCRFSFLCLFFILNRHFVFYSRHLFLLHPIFSHVKSVPAHLFVSFVCTVFPPLLQQTHF